MSFPAPKNGQAPDNAVHSREGQAVIDPTGERPRHNNAMGSQLCVLFCFFFRAGEITVPTDNSYDASRHLNFQDLALLSLERVVLFLAPTLACGVLSNTVTPRPSPALEVWRAAEDRTGVSTPFLRSRFTQVVAIEWE